jgi:hypothetical protein
MEALIISGKEACFLPEKRIKQMFLLYNLHGENPSPSVF